MKIFLRLFVFTSLIWGQIELPKNNSKDQIIHHLGYTISYNEIHEQPGLLSEIIDHNMGSTLTQLQLLKSEKEFILSNKELLSNRNRWHKNLKKDIFISEGINVLEQIFSNKSSSEMILAIKE